MGLPLNVWAIIGPNLSKPNKSAQKNISQKNRENKKLLISVVRFDVGEVACSNPLYHVAWCNAEGIIAKY